MYVQNSEIIWDFPEEEIHRSLSHSASNNKVYITTLLSPLTVDICVWDGGYSVFEHWFMCACVRVTEREWDNKRVSTGSH